MTEEQRYLPFEFNYAKFSLDPYTGSESYSTKLLKAIILKLNEPDFPGDKRLMDRFEHRKSPIKRRLVHISSPISDKGLRCFGRIALVKDKAPMIWGGKEVIEEIEKSHNKEFIEVTNYVIHFSTDGDPVIMIEYNHSGPRLSDVEWYFRQIAKEYKIAKAIKSSLVLDTDFNSLEGQLRNIFNVTVKLSPYGLNSTKSLKWYESLVGLKSETGYKDVKMELIFRKKKESGRYLQNIKGLDFARDILNFLKKDRHNIEFMDDLKMEYLVDGDDEIQELDFIKNKITSVLNIPVNENSIYQKNDFKEKVGQEFNHFLSTGETHQQA